MNPQPRIECDCLCDEPYDTWKRRHLRKMSIVSAIMSLVAFVGLVFVLSGCTAEAKPPQVVLMEEDTILKRFETMQHCEQFRDAVIVVETLGGHEPMKTRCR